MTSAFGVDHGHVSKGLPSALRNGAAGIKNPYLTRATGKRIMAHNAGRDQAKRISGNKWAFSGPQRGDASESGIKYRAEGKRSLEYLKRTGQRSRTPSGVRKSYVPGVGWKAAKGLSDTERHIVRNATLGEKAVRRAQGTKMQRAAARRKSNRKEIYPGQKTERGKLTRVMASRHQTGLHNPQLQGFSQPDGKGGGRVIIHNDAHDFVATARHELAHIKPRRNPVRFYERSQDPVRLGREEGRADFIGHQKTTPGSYPGNADFQRGYNEVQNKMAYARRNKK